MVRWLITLILTASSLLANIGEFTKVSGDVTIERGGAILPAAVGTQILESDAVKTSAKSKAELRFTDNTIINVGQNSDFSVEDYFFDQTENSRTTLNVTKGAFAAITGAIGKVAPNKFMLKTRTSTIGIRGTHFIGKITALGDTIACKDGAIAVGSIELDIEPVIVGAGMVTTVKLGQAPTPPRRFSPQEIQGLESTSGETTDKGGDKGGAAKEDGGEPEAGLEPVPTETEPELPPVEDVPVEIITSEEPAEEIITSLLPPVVDEENLDTIPSVMFSYGYYAYLTNSGGTFTQSPNNCMKGVRMYANALGEGRNARIEFTDSETMENVVFSFDTVLHELTDAGMTYDYLTWGAWDSSTDNPVGANPDGKQFFLAGQMTYFSDLPQSGYADYTGSLTGQSYNTSSGAISDVTGTTSFTVDFGSKLISSGSLTFTSGLSGSASVSSPISIIKKNGFSLFTGALSGSGSVSITGGFFGPGAEEMGGSWTYVGSGVNGGGVFAAKQ